MKTVYLHLSYSKSNKTNINKVAEALMENSVIFRTISYANKKVTFFTIYAMDEFEEKQIEMMLKYNESLIKAGCWIGMWQQA